MKGKIENEKNAHFNDSEWKKNWIESSVVLQEM